MATAQMYAPQGRRLPIHFQHELPFSAAGVRAMRAGVPIGARGPEAESLVVVDTGIDSAARERERERERLKAERTAGYEGRCDNALRFGQWVGLALALLFIAMVTVMVGVIIFRMNDIYQELRGADSSVSVTALLQHAMASARNTETATANLARVSTLAHETAVMATPRLQHAVNETTDIVEDLRSFSFSPKWTISTGGVTPVGRRS
jgi:multisubunit Na+/H+ antiporter MnhG subunit